MTFQVSVIIPVFNRERFIRTAIESAVQLEETGEILIVDDGSTDRSWQICSELSKSYPKIHLFKHKDGQNHGVSASRNLGIEKANCEYIAFLDADDFYLSDRFIRDREILTSNETIDGVYNALGIHYYSENGKKKFYEAGYQYQEFLTLSEPISQEELFCALFQQHPTCHGEFHVNTITVRKSVFQRTGVFPTFLKLKEDTHLWRRMAAICKLVPGNITKPVAIRGVHDENTMTNKSVQPDVNLLWWNDLRKWLINNKIKKSHIQCFERSYLYFQISTFPKYKVCLKFLVYFIQHLHYLKYQYGIFDTYLFQLTNHNKFIIRLVSFKNKLFGYQKEKQIYNYL